MQEMITVRLFYVYWGADAVFRREILIYGHFMPVKYLMVATTRKTHFVTWMREPVSRILSHFEYWKRNYNPKTATFLHRQCVEEDWSLERFGLGKELRNIYHQYFSGFPISNLDFVGITEYYEQDFRYFSEVFLRRSLPALQLNAAPKEEARISVDPILLKEIEEYHREDMALYAEMLQKRNARVEALE